MGTVLGLGSGMEKTRSGPPLSPPPSNLTACVMESSSVKDSENNFPQSQKVVVDEEAGGKKSTICSH